MGVGLFVLIGFDIAIGHGRLIPLLVVLALAYLVALVVANRRGLMSEPTGEIESGEVDLLRYMASHGPCTERDLVRVAGVGVSEDEIFNWAKDAEKRGLVTLLSNGHWQITEATRERVSGS
jgi:hypothetical protein